MNGAAIGEKRDNLLLNFQRHSFTRFVIEMTGRESSRFPFKHKRSVVRLSVVTLCEKLAAEGFAGISG